MVFFFSQMKNMNRIRAESDCLLKTNIEIASRNASCALNVICPAISTFAVQIYCTNKLLLYSSSIRITFSAYE
jgi:hypothetical protein